VSDPHPHQPDADRPRPPALTGDAAVDLLIANTSAGQSVLDFDDDPVLRAAAQVTGRRYQPLPIRLQTPGPPPSRGPAADLVTLAWPRPHALNPTAGAQALAVAARSLAPGGHVAVLLEPALAQAYTITWTGPLLAAARDTGLDYLQDVVCLHTGPGQEPVDDDIGVPGLRHRVVLVLRPGGRPR
jgi:hypothetical protein